jgi:hypothetical protein
VHRANHQCASSPFKRWAVQLQAWLNLETGGISIC